MTVLELEPGDMFELIVLIEGWSRFLVDQGEGTESNSLSRIERLTFLRADISSSGTDVLKFLLSLTSRVISMNENTFISRIHYEANRFAWGLKKVF